MFINGVAGKVAAALERCRRAVLALCLTVWGGFVSSVNQNK